MVQMMPTASSESAPVRRLSLFFVVALLLLLFIIICAVIVISLRVQPRAGIRFFSSYFSSGRKRARGMKFLFFPARVVFLSSLSLSL
jgi:hypothetical protein